MNVTSAKPSSYAGFALFGYDATVEPRNTDWYSFGSAARVSLEDRSPSCARLLQRSLNH